MVVGSKPEGKKANPRVLTGMAMPALKWLCMAVAEGELKACRTAAKVLL